MDNEIDTGPSSPQRISGGKYESYGSVEGCTLTTFNLSLSLSLPEDIEEVQQIKGLWLASL